MALSTVMLMIAAPQPAAHAGLLDDAYSEAAQAQLLMYSIDSRSFPSLGPIFQSKLSSYAPFQARVRDIIKRPSAGQPIRSRLQTDADLKRAAHALVTATLEEWIRTPPPRFDEWFKLHAVLIEASDFILKENALYERSRRALLRRFLDPETEPLRETPRKITEVFPILEILRELKAIRSLDVVKRWVSYAQRESAAKSVYIPFLAQLAGYGGEDWDAFESAEYQILGAQWSPESMRAFFNEWIFVKFLLKLDEIDPTGGKALRQKALSHLAPEQRLVFWMESVPVAWSEHPVIRRLLSRLFNEHSPSPPSFRNQAHFMNWMESALKKALGDSTYARDRISPLELSDFFESLWDLSDPEGLKALGAMIAPRIEEILSAPSNDIDAALFDLNTTYFVLRDTGAPKSNRQRLLWLKYLQNAFFKAYGTFHGPNFQHPFDALMESSVFDSQNDQRDAYARSFYALLKGALDEAEKGDPLAEIEVRRFREFVSSLPDDHGVFVYTPIEDRYHKAEVPLLERLALKGSALANRIQLHKKAVQTLKENVYYESPPGSFRPEEIQALRNANGWDWNSKNTKLFATARRYLRWSMESSARFEEAISKSSLFSRTILSFDFKHLYPEAQERKEFLISLLKHAAREPQWGLVRKLRRLIGYEFQTLPPEVRLSEQDLHFLLGYFSGSFESPDGFFTDQAELLHSTLSHPMLEPSLRLRAIKDVLIRARNGVVKHASGFLDYSAVLKTLERLTLAEAEKLALIEHLEHSTALLDALIAAPLLVESLLALDRLELTAGNLKALPDRLRSIRIKLIPETEKPDPFFVEHVQRKEALWNAIIEHRVAPFLALVRSMMDLAPTLGKLHELYQYELRLLQQVSERPKQAFSSLHGPDFLDTERALTEAVLARNKKRLDPGSCSASVIGNPWDPK